MRAITAGKSPPPVLEKSTDQPPPTRRSTVEGYSIQALTSLLVVIACQIREGECREDRSKAIL
jgi:hypothetical protein